MVGMVGRDGTIACDADYDAAIAAACVLARAFLLGGLRRVLLGIVSLRLAICRQRVCRSILAYIIELCAR